MRTQFRNKAISERAKSTNDKESRISQLEPRMTPDDIKNINIQVINQTDLSVDSKEEKPLSRKKMQ